jgi:3-oxoacyl-[acyl-carrier protein] reductase
MPEHTESESVEAGPPAAPDGRDRVAIVTGASRGIGEATARRLAADGYGVVLAARRAETLEPIAADIGRDGGVAAAIPTDVSDLDALDALVAGTVERFGRIDVVVNNAGMLPPARRAERIGRAEWQQVLDVNLTAPVHLARTAKAHMGRGGVIVNVSSTAAHYPSVGLLHYNASKAALSAATKGMALEWARDGIRVVAVAPGKIETELVAPILEWAERAQVGLNPMGRVGVPGEVADLIAFLVSDRAAFITGCSVTIDGGELLSFASDP